MKHDQKDISSLEDTKKLAVEIANLLCEQYGRSGSSGTCGPAVVWTGKFNPKVIIDLATLTGAIKVALGSTYAGLFCDDDALANTLIEAGNETGETGDEHYLVMMNSGQHFSRAGEAGSCTAAQFLKSFVKEGAKWAHLDIAGVAFSEETKDHCPKGATGYGVALLDSFVRKAYES